MFVLLIIGKLLFFLYSFLKISSRCSRIEEQESFNEKVKEIMD